MSGAANKLARTVAVAGGLSLSAGCASDVDESRAVSAIGECETEWVCGSNSPKIDFHGFHELHLEGEKNEQGFALESQDGLAQIYQGGRAYTLKVIDSQILGFDKGVLALSGQALVGAQLEVLVESQPAYTIVIDGVRQMSYPVGGGQLETYKLSWVGKGGPVDGKGEICAAPELLTDPANLAGPARRSTRPPPPVSGADELLGMYAGESVVFEGDRFNAAAMTMADRPEALWFNLGCAGHTLAKMHLTRHTLASGAEGFSVKHPERQATLKMLVADYCGDGTPFTVAGEPLRWKGGLVDYFAQPGGLEARWDEHGAVCLHEPRLRSTSSTLADDLFGNDIDAAIASRCQVPKCVDLDVQSFDGALRISGNP